MLNYSTGLVDTVTIDDKYNYGEIINFPKTIPYKDNSSLLATETYTFKGWSLDPSKDVANSEDELERMIVNTNNYIVAKNLSFTPVFMKEDVHKAVASAEYFNTFAATYTDINGLVYTGITIALNPVYTLQGKITLPAKIGNDKVIGIKADGFKNSSLITHIF